MQSLSTFQVSSCIKNGFNINRKSSHINQKRQLLRYAKLITLELWYNVAMNIKILGNGNWGNALYSVITQNCQSVSILKREQTATKADLVVLATPTQSIRESLKNISFGDKHKIIVNTTKGIEKSSHLLPFQIINKLYGNNISYFTLIGPSFAQEVTNKMPTLVNLAYTKKSSNGTEILKIRNLFQTNFFRVKLTTNVEALELSAAFKNIYAIACGLVQGLGYGTNTRVKLLVLAIDEIANLCKKLKWNVDPNATPGTIGDLVLTCNSTESRNFTFGNLLAKYSVEEALCKVNSTVEGFYSLNSVKHFEEQSKTNLPLANFVFDIVKKNNPEKVKTQFKSFVGSI